MISISTVKKKREKKRQKLQIELCMEQETERCGGQPQGRSNK